MDFWLIWHSLAMVAIVGISFAAGFFTCKILVSKSLKLKMINKSASKIQYENYATKWSPYKTVACLHLWQMIES